MGHNRAVIGRTSGVQQRNHQSISHVYIYSALLCAFCFGSFYVEGDHQGAQSGGKCFPMYLSLSLTHTSEGREGIFASSAFPIGVYLGKGGGGRGGGVFNLLFSSPVPCSLPPLLLALGRRTEKERKRGTFSPPASFFHISFLSAGKEEEKARKPWDKNNERGERGHHAGEERRSISPISTKPEERGSHFPVEEGGRGGGQREERRKEGSNRAACNKNTSLCPSPPPPNPIYNIYLAVQFCSTPFLSFPLSSLSFSFYHSPLFFPLGALFSLRSLKKASSKKPQKLLLLLLSPTPVATFK